MCEVSYIFVSLQRRALFVRTHCLVKSCLLDQSIDHGTTDPLPDQ